MRDGIPEIIRASGIEPEVRALKGRALIDALLDKLAEEANELRSATPDEQLEELADLLEVVRGLALLLGVSFAAVEEAAALKLSERGGFTRGLWLAMP